MDAARDGCEIGEPRPDSDPTPDGIATAEAADILAGQRVVRGVTERLLHAGSSDLDARIGDALRDLGEFLDMDRVYVFAFEGSTIRNTHEWCAPGIRPEIDNLSAMPVETIGHWLPTLSVGRPCVVSDVPGLPLDSPERAVLIEQGIRSLIVVPMLAPSTTEITVRPLRVADETWLKPEAQMKPVFMPSAPGNRPINRL